MTRFLLAAISIVLLAGCSPEENQVENINNALSTMLKFEESLAVYKFDMSKYPTSSEGLTALRTAPASAENWNGPYYDEEIPLDPWGNPYVYEHGAGIYQILSAGPDAELGTDDDLVTTKKIIEEGSSSGETASP